MGVLNELRRRVFDYIVSREPKGATCDEVEVGLNMSHQTASARINELHNEERKFFGGQQFIFMTKRERNTRSRRPAAVYRPIWAQGLEVDKDWLRSSGSPPKDDQPEPLKPPEPETNAYCDEQGRILNRGCLICGAPAPFSVGTFVRKGILGLWYCWQHWPGRAALEKGAARA